MKNALLMALHDGINNPRHSYGKNRDSFRWKYRLKSFNAVIDKDFARNVLAQKLKEEYLIILTAVEKVAVNFGKENVEWLDSMTPIEAKKCVKQA